MATAGEETAGRFGHLRPVAREELGGLGLRLWSALTLMRLLPPLVGNRTRTRLLRLAGVPVGHGTTIGGSLVVAGARRPALRIGRDCWINGGCHIDASAPVEIGDDVALAHQVLVLTSTHRISDHRRRAGVIETAPVSIGSGAWLGARVVVLPGVTIGAGSIVAAGSVVTDDVPPDTVVGGVPARVIRGLDADG